MILSAVLSLLVSASAAGQTWTPGTGTEAVFAPLRSAYAGTDKMIDVDDLDGAWIKSASVTGDTLTLTVQNASDVEETVLFDIGGLSLQPADILAGTNVTIVRTADGVTVSSTGGGGGGAAATEESFVGTFGALTGVVQATFDNIFAITETFDAGDGFTVSASPSAITVPSAGRYWGCTDVQIEQTTDGQANGRVVGVVRFSVTSNAITTASPVEGSAYIRGNSGDLASGSADVCALLDLAAADTVEVEFQAEIQNGAIDITAGNVSLTLVGGIQGAAGAAGAWNRWG